MSPFHKAPLDDDEKQSRLDFHLAEAAALWVDLHGVDEWGDSYSTCQNRFLYASENAYFVALEEAKEALSPPPPPSIPNSGFHLYRLWTAEDRLLYVGVSTRLASRLRAHRRRWTDLIDHITWEQHDDAASMLAAEALAIQEELPALNKAGIG